MLYDILPMNTSGLSSRNFCELRLIKIAALKTKEASPLYRKKSMLRNSARLLYTDPRGKTMSILLIENNTTDASKRM